jgi:alkanesulfonate monooxygenase SsuD/methylene tetrahydromethanopterin reductase-like flavin-dependent oxidoreductase (luciferase family)
VEFFLYLPQMRLTLPELVDRARVAETAGWTGIGLMDHLAPPMADGHPMYEAMTAATWLAAHTETLRIGHLVLCESFRHPAVLARQAVTLDHASGGRFELGIGSGSVPSEFARFGIPESSPRDRHSRLEATLRVISSLWTGEPVDENGEFWQLRAATQLPVPLDRIPIVIGGTGARTLQLAAHYADWWNAPVGAVGRIDKLRHRVGAARVSVLQMVAYVPPGGDKRSVRALAERRFAWAEDLVVGGDDELVAYFSSLGARGVERAYVWFTDFATPQTLHAFASGVALAVP